MKPKPQHAAAHIITSIDADHEIGEWHEPHGTLSHVAHFPEDRPGVQMQARLGPSGLQLLRGEIVVCIPLELLFDLATAVNPKFNAPPDKVLTPKEAEAVAKLAAPAPSPAADVEP